MTINYSNIWQIQNLQLWKYLKYFKMTPLKDASIQVITTATFLKQFFYFDQSEMNAEC